MNFKEFFEDYARKHDQTDECYESNLRKELKNKFNAEETFKILPTFIDFLLEQSDPYFSCQLLEIIHTLVMRTHTTELPKGMLERIKLLEIHFSSNNDYAKRELQQLKEWYRIRD